MVLHDAKEGGPAAHHAVKVLGLKVVHALQPPQDLLALLHVDDTSFQSLALQMNQLPAPSKLCPRVQDAQQGYKQLGNIPDMARLGAAQDSSDLCIPWGAMYGGVDTLMVLSLMQDAPLLEDSDCV